MARPSSKSREPSIFTKFYLVLYNLVSCASWSYVLYLTYNHVLQTGAAEGIWRVIEHPLKLAQTMAVLEIVHSLIGLVRSPVFTTAAQVYSRLFLVWLILHLENVSHYSATESWAVVSLMTAWGITEIIRYSFYGLKQINMCPSIVTYLRYTTFIVLYPIGVTSEILCAWFKLHYIDQERPYSLTMPNRVNMTIDTYWVAIITLLLYIPVFPMLYMHMFSQRKKVLGGGGAEKKKKQQ